MNTALFGISLVSLFSAIAQVESSGGLTSDNVYQISEEYIADVNGGIGRERAKYSLRDRLDRDASERIMIEYWAVHGLAYYRKTGKTPSAEVLARIHNGGPNGWRKPATLKYWHRVKAAMDAAEGEPRK